VGREFDAWCHDKLGNLWCWLWVLEQQGFDCPLSFMKCYALVSKWFAVKLLEGSSDTREQRWVERLIACIGTLETEFLDSDGLVGALDAVVILNDDWGAIEADRVDGEAAGDVGCVWGCGWVFEFGLCSQRGRGGE